MKGKSNPHVLVRLSAELLPLRSSGPRSVGHDIKPPQPTQLWGPWRLAGVSPPAASTQWFSALLQLCLNWAAFKAQVAPKPVQWEFLGVGLGGRMGQSSPRHSMVRPGWRALGSDFGARVLQELTGCLCCFACHLVRGWLAPLQNISSSQNLKMGPSLDIGSLLMSLVNLMRSY